MNDLSICAAIILAVFTSAIIGFAFIDWQKYKVIFRKTRMELNRPSVKITIPVHTEVAINFLDEKGESVSKSGRVTWSAGNQLTIEDREGVTHYSTLSNIIHTFETR